MAHIVINICITNSILWQMFFSSSGSIMWQNHGGLTNATCSNGRNSTGAFWSTNWLTIQLILWLAWFDWFIDDSTDWFTQPWVIQVGCSPLIGDVVWRRRKVCEVWDHIKMGGLRKSDDPPCVAKGDMMDIPLFPDRLTFLLTEVSSAENLRLPSLATSGEAVSLVSSWEPRTVCSGCSGHWFEEDLRVDPDAAAALLVFLQSWLGDLFLIVLTPFLTGKTRWPLGCLFQMGNSKFSVCYLNLGSYP